MKHLIFLCGYAGSGKDTLANHIWAEAAGEVTRLSFAKKLKDICSTLFNVPRELFDDPTYKNVALIPGITHPYAVGKTPRQLAQHFGTDVCRETYGYDFWIKHAVNQINDAYTCGSDIVIFTDTRFLNEITDTLPLLAHSPKVSVIRIHRGDVGPANGHVSEVPFEYPGMINFHPVEVIDGDTGSLYSMEVEELMESIGISMDKEIPF